MQTLIDYRYVIICAVMLIVTVMVQAYTFMHKTPEQKADMIEQYKEAVIKWLRYYVWKAEKEFGSGTGQLKLATVYATFTEKFPYLATLITYELFDEWVNEALVWLNNQLKDNANVKELTK